MLVLRVALIMQWGDVIDMDEFRDVCNGQQVIAYMRVIDGHWIENAKSYWDVNGMRQPLRIDPPYGLLKSDQQRQAEPVFHSSEEISTYFQPYANVSCLVLGFVFRNLGGNALWDKSIEFAHYVKFAPSVIRVR